MRGGRPAGWQWPTKGERGSGPEGGGREVGHGWAKR
jgi:hypothetical protein